MATGSFKILHGHRGQGEVRAYYEAQVGARNKASVLVHCEDINLPPWAPSAVDFFRAADRRERSNGRTYYEIIAQIPREAGLDAHDTIAWVDWAREAVNGIIGDRHVARWAVHCTRADDGGPNPHVHIQFSPRTLDGIPRTEERFFRRANSKNPLDGGAPKDRIWGKTKGMRAKVGKVIRSLIHAIIPGWRKPGKRVTPRLIRKMGAEELMKREEVEAAALEFDLAEGLAILDELLVPPPILAPSVNRVVHHPVVNRLTPTLLSSRGARGQRATDDKAVPAPEPAAVRWPPMSQAAIIRWRATVGRDAEIAAGRVPLEQLAGSDQRNGDRGRRASPGAPPVPSPFPSKKRPP